MPLSSQWIKAKLSMSRAAAPGPESMVAKSVSPRIGDSANILIKSPGKHYV